MERSENTPLETPTKASLRLAKDAHTRLDRGLATFKKIRLQIFGALGIIIPLAATIIWRTSAVMKELEYTNRRLDRIENVLYRKDLAMAKETCAGCGKATDKGLINVVVISHQVMKSNCEHCADPNDYRTPVEWRGARISDTTVITPHVVVPSNEPIGQPASMVINNDVVDLSHYLNEAEQRNPGFILEYSAMKAKEAELRAKKEAEDKAKNPPEKVSDLPLALQKLKDEHEARLAAVKAQQEEELAKAAELEAAKPKEEASSEVNG